MSAAQRRLRTRLILLGLVVLGDVAIADYALGMVWTVVGVLAALGGLWAVLRAWDDWDREVDWKAAPDYPHHPFRVVENDAEILSFRRPGGDAA